MTMTPEERAKVVMSWLRQECSDAICTHLDCPSCGCMAYLAQAIREAEDAALERAAVIVERNGESQSEGWRANPKKDGCGGAIAATNTSFLAAQYIRSLKHKD